MSHKGSLPAKTEGKIAVKKYMILFSVGKDRPGIVDCISKMLFENGANIEDSRMAAMGGRFTIMTLFSCSEEQAESVRANLNSLQELGLETSLHEAEAPTAGAKTPGLPLKMQVTAMDHPGIVQKVVHLLHRHNVNIETLDTQINRAPLSGTPLFDLFLEAIVPEETTIGTVKMELGQLAVEMNLNLKFDL